MPKISTRVTFDKKAAAARIRAVANDALTVMGNQALKDVTQYVPLDQGTLQSSGLSSSDRAAHDMKFDLQWLSLIHIWSGTGSLLCLSRCALTTRMVPKYLHLL